MGLFDIPDDAKQRLDELIRALNRMAENMGRLAEATEKQNKIEIEKLKRADA